MTKAGQNIIVVLLGVLLLAILGGFFYIQSVKNGLSALPVEEVAIEDLGPWQVYTNEEYGFSFEYPKQWIIEREGPKTVTISSHGEGSKNIVVELPYPDGITEGEEFLIWANTQEWPFAPVTPEEYFREVVVPSGLKTYSRADSEFVHTVITTIGDNVVYIRRTDGEGEGNIEGEDIYFHTLNTFKAL